MLYSNIEEIMKIIVEEGENRFTSAGNPKTWTPYLKENGITVVHGQQYPICIKSAKCGC
jgi:enoyl-[acyl-carrier protein] reductase II